MSRETKSDNSKRMETFYNTHFGTQERSREPQAVQLEAIKHYSPYLPKDERGKVQRDGYTVGFTVHGHPGVEVHTHLSDDAGLTATSVQTPHDHTKAEQRKERGRRRFSLHAEQNLFPQMAALLDSHHQTNFPNQVGPVYQSVLPGPTKAERQQEEREWAQTQANARAQYTRPEQPQSPVSRKREHSPPPREALVQPVLNLPKEEESPLKRARSASPQPTVPQPRQPQQPQQHTQAQALPQQPRPQITFQLNNQAKKPALQKNAFFK